MAATVRLTCGDTPSKTHYYKSHNCRPKLMAFGGLSDKGTKVMRRFADVRAEELGIETEYFYRDEAGYAVRAMRRHYRDYPDSPITLVGHSMGGSPAYLAAKAMSNRAPFLVTLDALGGEAYRSRPNFDEFKRQLERPNGVRWINVHMNRPGFAACLFTLGGVLMGRTGDCLADFGATWGHQEHALNINQHSGANHSDAERMYQSIRHEVEASLLCEKEVRPRWTS